jgi:sterol 24-C-methyltransferase
MKSSSIEDRVPTLPIWNSTVAGGVDDYAKLHAETTLLATRTEKYKALVNAYYDLATVFYEWGWGQCFHFP